MTEKTVTEKSTKVPVARETGADGRGDASAGTTTEEGSGSEATALGILAQTEQTLEGWAGLFLPRAWGARAARATSTIFVDEWRDTADWVVEAELPGIDPDRDVTLRLDRHMLELVAERRSQAAQHGASNRRELRAGRLTRTLPVPRGADPSRASAIYEDGILTVRVPVEPDGIDAPQTLSVSRA